MKQGTPLVILVVLALTVVSSVGFFQLREKMQAVEKQLKELQDEFRMLHLPELEAGEITVFFVKETATDFLLVPVKRSVPYAPNARAALEEQLRGPLLYEDLQSIIPATTQILGMEIQDQLATVNFSLELKRDFVGGALLEAHLVDSIVRTLTQFDTISQVQILIEGEKVESLAGHIHIQDPLDSMGTQRP